MSNQINAFFMRPETFAKLASAAHFFVETTAKPIFHFLRLLQNYCSYHKKVCRKTFIWLSGRLFNN
ncbi:MAG: hypothetical protein IK065_03575 [Neisseriaceae bacterium]|nr:hypothetical protein [Neisseriaceae bacterium]